MLLQASLLLTMMLCSVLRSDSMTNQSHVAWMKIHPLALSVAANFTRFGKATSNVIATHKKNQ